MSRILWPAFAYLLGSVPFGLLVAKGFKGVDPRTEGSGNIGATNVARLCGATYGALALALDLLKGLVPVLLAKGPDAHWLLLSLTALAAILGHVFPIFLGFKGGKAVATTIGAFLALAPWAAVWSVVLCVAVIALSGYVSMGSLTLGLCLPLFCLFTGAAEYLPVALAVMALLFWRHKDNIRRLASGEEHPWRSGKKEKQE
ncbi:MAG: glycerol-3-phosphate 1-O-acyltransferase PlsY [Desulfovibrionaceae bacterium]|nr:glycerol-3-phosphate 1-O-acyltransferase PlsY [Desulfovibrionaceae bacterium]